MRKRSGRYTCAEYRNHLPPSPRISCDADRAGPAPRRPRYPQPARCDRQQPADDTTLAHSAYVRLLSIVDMPKRVLLLQFFASVTVWPAVVLGVLAGVVANAQDQTLPPRAQWRASSSSGAQPAME